MTATPSFPRTVLLAAASVAALGSFAVLPAFAQTDPAGGDPAPTGGGSIMEADIATEPLYSQMSGDKPTMLLAPSIEFPTVGAQYRTTDDYSPDDEYIGYYNAEKCYVYDYDPDDGDDDDDDEDDDDDDDIKDQGYFKISGNATGRKCSGNTFSGNFLNWATSSSMDIMRLALTGGDRILDTRDETILQRAYLPDGTAQVSSVTLWDGTKKTKEKPNWQGKIFDVDRGPGCFFNNGGQFPAKKLTLTQAEGAVPAIMIEQARAQGPAYAAIHVGNMGNRIYFGFFKGAADCTSAPQKYTLGTSRDAPETERGWRELSDFIPPGHPDAPTGPNDSRFEEYCVDAKGVSEGTMGCNGNKKRYTVWYGSVAGGWAVAEVDANFRCTNRGNDDGYQPNLTGGGNRLSSANPTTFPTPPEEIPNRGCWMATPKKPAKGDSKYALNSKGYFLARVKVCDANDERDYAMCTEYPSGKKKPTGVIQRHADNLRLAAFGYAIDQTASHATDDYKGRFGALLRAPMKYVGPNTYDHTGVKKDETNPKAEWNEQTGVLVKNPDSVSGSNFSGVINYFNRFGRNPDKRGNYKQYDNVAEMYYEALRYMQGLSPSPKAVLDITPDMKDGMPAYTSWDGLDPFDSDLGYTKDGDYTCVKNSILVIGDINTHDPVNGNVDGLRDTMGKKDATKNEIDIKHWRDVVRGFETKTATAYKDGYGTQRTTSRPNSDPSFPSDVGGGELGRNLWSFLPGMAYWAHTHDIRGTNWTAQPAKQRPGLRITSYFFDVNESQMSTRYTARVGSTNTGGTPGKVPNNNGVLAYNGYWGNQYWLAAKYGGFRTGTVKAEDCEDGTVYDFNTLGNPFYKVKCTVDGTGAKSFTQAAQDNGAIWSDLSKAQGDNENGATQPEPRTYYMPSNARGVLKAFEDIFGDTEPPGNRSIAGADSSGGLGGTSFQAEFNGADWSGDVIAESIAVGSGTEKVRANNNLPSHDARKIFMGTSTHSNPRAFEFKADSVPNDVSSALGGDINGVNATAADRINWLRGDQSKEGSPFRARTRLLGDIINSGVKYVGAPAGQVNLGLGYAAFVEAQTYRRAAVYVGANDGMLHAFHAGGKRLDTTTTPNTVTEVEPTLAELFAYIPSWMKGKLAALTDPAYINKHQAYVDATPVIGDANLKGDCTVTNSPNAGDTDCDWRSVLVSGTGGGGRGVFALDVTNPEAFDASKVLWEFTDADDPDMGYVLGQARIVKLLFTEADTTTTPPTPAVYRWFAMVPAGVNNYEGDDTARRGNGDANIFLLALDKAADTAWTLNSNYWKLQLPRIQTLQAKYPTGILNLEAFTGLGGVTEYVYAGDLHGQLWAFKFKGIDSTGWNTATLANCYSSGSCQEGAVKPLFIATTPADGDGNTKPQPITVAPSILEGAGNGVHFVSFGTGKYFEPTDAQSTKVDTFYTVYSNFNHTAAQILSRNNGDAIIPDRSYLQEVVKDRTEGEVNYFKPSQAFFWGWLASAPTAGDTPNIRSGWFMDFVERGENGATTAVGERQIADASWISLTSRLMFSTLTPNSATNTDVCGTGGGDSKLYTFDMISGMGTGRHSAVGMLAQPLVFLDTANTRETQADSTGRRLRISPVMSGQFGSDGSDVSQVDTVIVPFGRLSWRRIDNFEGLRQAGGTSNPSAGGSGAGGSDSGNSDSGDE